jgi:hypothetical protein
VVLHLQICVFHNITVDVRCAHTDNAVSTHVCCNICVYLQLSMQQEAYRNALQNVLLAAASDADMCANFDADDS